MIIFSTVLPAFRSCSNVKFGLDMFVKLSAPFDGDNFLLIRETICGRSGRSSDFSRDSVLLEIDNINY